MRLAPHLTRAECDRRAADIDVLQDAMWLTALRGSNRRSVKRAIERCEDFGLAP